MTARAKAAGFENRYIEKGRGEPLVLLHGNGEDCGYFEAQTEYFSQYYRVLAVDTRGHGRTPRGDAPFTLSQFADDLYGFLCAQNIDKAHLLGFSDGGNIALLFALRYPHRTGKLILNGANFRPCGLKAAVYLSVLFGYIKARLRRQNASAELLALMLREPRLRARELSGVAAETLVIAGTKDMIRRAHTERMARRIPASKLVFVEGGHFIARTDPTRFNQAVEEFLRG